uniref:Retinol dehydrogenase 14-like n=1 Tax=Saccoglossus kowalevskii TaxID=10224 RepID=A0ABM0MUM3_SACKO|nr:PREDICTED: retinol dehydrogenase 14-like [Saccoglossus kowalevskii]
MDFINNFKMKECSLNILICNAGISCPPKELTEDGFEQQFQVNYLSHLLLTLHLMPILIASGPGSRIVNVSSMSYLRGEFDLGNIQGQQLYDRLKCYGNSKLYQIMSMFCLQRRLDDSEVTVTSLHPGSVDTNIAQSFQDHWFQYIYKGYRNLGLFIDAEKAAAACIDVAVNPEYDGVSGTYFEHGKRKIPSALSRSVKKQEELWEYSMQCLKGYYQQRGYLIW